MTLAKRGFTEFKISLDDVEGVFENLDVPFLVFVFYTQVAKIVCKWKCSTSVVLP